MSDQPKRARIWPAIIVALLLFYPLSTGPVAWLCVHCDADESTLQVIRTVYEPLFHVAEATNTEAWLLRYILLFINVE